MVTSTASQTSKVSPAGHNAPTFGSLQSLSLPKAIELVPELVTALLAKAVGVRPSAS